MSKPQYYQAKGSNIYDNNMNLVAMCVSEEAAANLMNYISELEEHNENLKQAADDLLEECKLLSFNQYHDNT